MQDDKVQSRCQHDSCATLISIPPVKDLSRPPRTREEQKTTKNFEGRGVYSLRFSSELNRIRDTCARGFTVRPQHCPSFHPSGFFTSYPLRAKPEKIDV
jgi:hypothetical protein